MTAVVETVRADGFEYIHTLGDACVVLDRDLCVVAANAAAEHLYVCAHGRMRGVCLAELEHDDDVDSLRFRLKSLGGVARSFVVRQTCADGSSFVGDITAKRLHGGEGFAILTVRRKCTSTDPADVWLRSEMLDLAPDGMYAYTPEGHLVYANDPAMRLFGIEADPGMEREPWFWVPEGEHDRISHRLNALFDEGTLYYESCRSGSFARAHCEIRESVAQTTRGKIIVGSVRDISNRRIAEEEVRYLAYHDTLTGLANRMLFNQEASHALSAAERHRDTVGMVYLDLDDFKPVNDTHGHAVGDLVLCRVAERITACVRLTDTVARLGGDEFVVLLPRLTDAADLTDVARKVAAEIEKPIFIAGKRITVTASMGTALYHRGEGIDELMHRADEQMYRSRQTGVPGWMSTAS